MVKTIMLMEVTPDLPETWERIQDELELATYDLPPEACISAFIEATARCMARTEIVPDRRFLDVLQQRTVEILTEETSDA
jgi:hypothetical protein